MLDFLGSFEPQKIEARVQNMLWSVEFWVKLGIQGLGLFALGREETGQ